MNAIFQRFSWYLSGSCCGALEFHSWLLYDAFVSAILPRKRTPTSHSWTKVIGAMRTILTKPPEELAATVRKVGYYRRISNAMF